MKSEQLDSNFHKFSYDLKANESAHHLFISDIHFDSKECRRDILERDLKQAKEKGASVFIFGDLFDVMASFGDRRLRQIDIRPEYFVSGHSYLDLVIDDCYEFLKPYASNIKLISLGNHEQSIIKYHDTNPIRRLVTRLNMLDDVNIQQGDYSGDIIFSYSDKCPYFYVNYHHGFGGNAKRSKGVLQVDIEHKEYPDADIIVRGHTHQKFYYPSTIQRRIKGHERFKKQVHYIQSGSYVDGIAKGKHGFAVERGFSQTSLGGYWIDMTIRMNKDRNRRVIPKIYETEVIEF
jgi:UDP-2,3-diacylglucosamine pyrophosphatase LpxH